MHDLDALRRVHLADQTAGARYEAAAWVRKKADGQPVRQDWRPSRWVVALVREARRNRCAHWPREGAVLVFVLATVRQMQCKPCTVRALAMLADSADRVRCDVCREVAALEPFAFHAGSTLVVTGRSCAGCLPTVTGGAA